MATKKKTIRRAVTFTISDKEGFPMKEANDIPVGECKELMMTGKAQQIFGDKIRVCKTETGFNID